MKEVKNVPYVLMRGAAGKKILDIGTGTGIIPRLLITHSPVGCISKVIGIDISTNMISTASSMTGDRSIEKYFVCDIEDTEKLGEVIGKHEFDVICFSFVFSWFTNKQKALDNAIKFLRPGGVVLVLEESFRNETHMPEFSKYTDGTSALLEDVFKLAQYVPHHELIEMMSRRKLVCIKDCSSAIDEVHDVVGLVFGDRRTNA